LRDQALSTTAQAIAASRKMQQLRAEITTEKGDAAPHPKRDKKKGPKEKLVQTDSRDLAEHSQNRAQYGGYI